MLEVGALVFILTIPSQNVPAPEGEGLLALEQGRYRDAIRVFEALLASDPENVFAHFGKGRALSALEEHDGAIAAFETAVSLEPTMVAAHYEHARSLEALHAPEQAVESYRVVLELDPYHRGARYRLGNVLLRTGMEEEAERLLRGYEPFRLWDHQVRLLEAMIGSESLEPDDRKEKTLAWLRLLLDGGDLEQAGRALAAAVEDYPEEGRITIARARWLMLVGRESEARAVLDSVMKAGFAERDAVWLSAQLNVRARRKLEALADYETLMTLWPDPPAKVHQEIGTTYAVNDRLLDAITHFEKALAAEPRLAQVQADLGLALAGVDRPDDAEVHYLAALEIRPGLVPAQQGLASLLLERGDTHAAIELFRESVARHPRNPVLRKNLALALFRAGKVEESEAELRKARGLESRPE
ncbi:MAG: tetratricopeptide repeat protein [Acidobacteria bacterium]|nr:MAG: tetratricopeptide repeat protein [Acidobacteriota bacterium]